LTSVDLGVLLSFPVESVAVRAVLATVGAVVLVRLLLRTGGLTSPRARVATALAPAAALVAVVLVTGTTLRLPTLMLPAQGVDALPIPVRDGYLHFAPIAAPLLVGSWALVALVRLVRRGRGWLGARAAAGLALARGSAPPEVRALARRVAAALEVTTPRVAVVEGCPGGAFVAGVRRPVVVLSATLVERLDADELEGVLAHELAHVKRRDNLVATALGALRDVTFFVPGGGWAVRQLHRERELAADQIAVTATGRPGALASGLLKVLEAGPREADPCAAFAPAGGLVDRVKVLVDDRPQPSRTRRSWETVAVVGAVLTAVVAALLVPATVAGAERQRDAVALVWSSTSSAAADIAAPDGQPRAFDVYRRSTLDVVEPTRGAVAHGQVDERSLENRRATLHACADERGGCPSPDRSVGLGMRPAPTITVDDSFTARWQPTPIAGADATDGLRLFWLSLK
jgi:Zn-dependent protease with chaperone function